MGNIFQSLNQLSYPVFVTFTIEIGAVFPAESVVVPPMEITPRGKVEILTVVVQLPPAGTGTVRDITPLLPEILKDTRAEGSAVPETTSDPLTFIPATGAKIVVAGETCVSFFNMMLGNRTMLLAESLPVTSNERSPSANGRTLAIKLQVPSGETVTGLVLMLSVLPSKSEITTKTSLPASANPLIATLLALACEMTY